MDQNDFKTLQSRHDLRLKLEDYEMQELIERGSWGSVYKAKHTASGRKVAVKVMSKQTLTVKHQVDHLYRQLHCLSQLNDTSFPRLVGVTQQGPFVFIFSQLIGSHSSLGLSTNTLSEYLSLRISLCDKQVKFCASQLVTAVATLHSLGFIHRDLRPENVVIDGQGHLKLIDFDYARRINSQSNTFCGTFQFMAPQIINRRPQTKAVDLWALGVLLFQLCQGRQLFGDSESDPVAIFSKINDYCYKKFNVKFKHSKPEVQSLILNLLKPQPIQRLGNSKDCLAEFQKHIFFSDIKLGHGSWSSICSPLLDSKGGSGTVRSRTTGRGWYMWQIGLLKQEYGEEAYDTEYSKALLPM